MFLDIFTSAFEDRGGDEPRNNGNAKWESLIKSVLPPFQ